MQAGRSSSEPPTPLLNHSYTSPPASQHAKHTQCSHRHVSPRQHSAERTGHLNAGLPIAGHGAKHGVGCPRSGGPPKVHQCGGRLSAAFGLQWISGSVDQWIRGSVSGVIQGRGASAGGSSTQPTLPAAPAQKLAALPAQHQVSSQPQAKRHPTRQISSSPAQHPPSAACVASQTRGSQPPGSSPAHLPPPPRRRPRPQLQPLRPGQR